MKRPFNKHYFEGWYFKQSDRNCNHTISFIPSISFSKKTSRAYIQVMYQKGNDLINDLCEYDISEFTTRNTPFRVQIKNNYFSQKKIHLNFQGEKLSINGAINFSALTRLDSSFINPNIMGFFSYIPFMQCNHGILSMNHALSGSLYINGENISFQDGRGYIEKDWGSSFPKNYIWLQCNHFKHKNSSLFFSVAHIPMLYGSFNGFICNLLLDKRQYRFATYTGAKVYTETENQQIKISIKSKNSRLNIRARPNHSRELRAPKNGEMSLRIKEALSGHLEITLKDHTSDRVIYNDESRHAAMETVGRF